MLSKPHRRRWDNNSKELSAVPSTNITQQHVWHLKQWKSLPCHPRQVNNCSCNEEFVTSCATFLKLSGGCSDSAPKSCGPCTECSSEGCLLILVSQCKSLCTKQDHEVKLFAKVIQCNVLNA